MHFRTMCWALKLAVVTVTLPTAVHAQVSNTLSAYFWNIVLMRPLLDKPVDQTQSGTFISSFEYHTSKDPDRRYSQLGWGQWRDGLFITGQDEHRQLWHNCSQRFVESHSVSSF